MAIEELQSKWRHTHKPLGLIKLRERFHPLNAPPCEAADVRKVAGKFYSLTTSSTMQHQATKYSNDWKAKRWEDILRPVVVEGAAADFVDAVAFWNRDEMKHEFPRIREIAMYYLSVWSVHSLFYTSLTRTRGWLWATLQSRTNCLSAVTGRS